MQHPARICGKNRRRKAAIHLKSGAENHGLSAADADNFSKNAKNSQIHAILTVGRDVR